jgi:hypothetical protein
MLLCSFSVAAASVPGKDDIVKNHRHRVYSFRHGPQAILPPSSTSTSGGTCYTFR